MRYFTPGPSQLYPIVPEAMAEALAGQIPSISHRSQAFKDIVARTNAALTSLLNIPADYSIWYLSSANEAWERILQNCVRQHSFHLVNGSFSSKFHGFALDYGKKPLQHKVPFGQGFRLQDINVPAEAELIAAIANETSSGVQTDPKLIYALKERHPEKLVVVDVVSAYPAYELDLSRVDGAYFSVQKGFGLPAGLGVMLAGPRLRERAQELESEGQVVGAYHRFTELEKYAQKLQTPATPNVMGIYLLGKVAEDMLKGEGRAGLRRIHEEKKAALWRFFDDFEGLRHFVAAEDRSETVVVLDCDKESSFWIKALREKGFSIGAGYGDRTATQLRIANFPSMGVGDVEALLAGFGDVLK